MLALSYWINLAAAACGGAVGAAGRYAVGVWAKSTLGAGWPWGTLIVNASGGLIMGVGAALIFGRTATPQAGVDVGLWPALLLTGLLGGFTTFSAFSLETVLLAEVGRPAAAAAYAVCSVLTCVAAAALGLALARAYLLAG